MKKKPGRPRKITPSIEKKILALIEAGNFAETAAQASGVSTSAFYRHQSKFPEFREAIARARASAEVKLVGVVVRSGETDPGANKAAWLLERMNRRRFGPQVRVMVDQEMERIMSIARRVLDPAAYYSLVEALHDEEREALDPGDRSSGVAAAEPAGPRVH